MKDKNDLQRRMAGHLEKAAFLLCESGEPEVATEYLDTAKTLRVPSRLRREVHPYAVM